MKENIVSGVISNIAMGNNKLEAVMRDVYICGKDIIDTWPDEDRGILVRKTFRATSRLIRKKIKVSEILSLGDQYWETDNGIEVDAALTKYVERRKISS